MTIAAPCDGGGSEFEVQRFTSEDGEAVPAILQQSLMLVAVRHGHVGVVARLLDAGANRAAKDQHGKTALDYARAGKHKALVALLEAPPPPVVA